MNEMSKATQIVIKERNIGIILKTIKRNDSVTRINISKETRLAKSTISGLTSFLLSKNIIIEGRKVNSFKK